MDDTLTPGFGRRLDGWANRDLNVGAIVASAPDLTVFEELLGLPEETVREVLNSWGPGKFDAQLILDGKAFRPDGKSAATLIPSAFGLAGVNNTPGQDPGEASPTGTLLSPTWKCMVREPFLTRAWMIQTNIQSPRGKALVKKGREGSDDRKTTCPSVLSVSHTGAESATE